jgi:hypothetical protein
MVGPENLLLDGERPSQGGLGLGVPVGVAEGVAELLPRSADLEMRGTEPRTRLASAWRCSASASANRALPRRTVPSSLRTCASSTSSDVPCEPRERLAQERFRANGVLPVGVQSRQDEEASHGRGIVGAQQPVAGRERILEQGPGRIVEAELAVDLAHHGLEARAHQRLVRELGR